MPLPGMLKNTLFRHSTGPIPASAGHRQLQFYEHLTPADDRLLFAHSDWSGYSVFEEAFTRGHAAGMTVPR